MTYLIERVFDGRMFAEVTGGLAVRTLVVWCPDWPVIAVEVVEGIPATGRVAVVRANRVIACSEAARAEGVRRGLRKREAQSRCPRLTVVEHEPDRDARAFEPVVAAVEEMAVGVEVIRPGACGLAVRGPARYFGGEERAAEAIVEHIAQACAVESQIGIADGVFAAELAARTGLIIPPTGTPEFLAGLPVAALAGAGIAASAGGGAQPRRRIGTAGGRRSGERLRDGDRAQLIDLLRRMGVRTLGDFAALPAADVLSRFGFDASLAHRLAAGRDHRPLAVRRPPPDLDVADTYDEPLDRVDVAAFAARSLAERLHARLAGHGLACTRLAIEAVTADGQELHRVWRHDGLLTAMAIADRVRWQLDGWISGRRERPTSGIVRLRLVPEGVLVHAGLQPGLWGETGEERERAQRAFSRVQGMIGAEAVSTAVIGGGRSPGDQARMVPWGDERMPARPAPPAPPTVIKASQKSLERLGGRPDHERGAPPWPGRMPWPQPVTVLPAPVPVIVYDATGGPVAVSARLEVSAAPARVVIGTDRTVEVICWAGPWPVEERWWAPDEASRRARFQMGLADGRSLLLSLAGGVWAVEAVYD